MEKTAFRVLQRLFRRRLRLAGSNEPAEEAELGVYGLWFQRAAGCGRNITVTITNNDNANYCKLIL